MTRTVILLFCVAAALVICPTGRALAQTREAAVDPQAILDQKMVVHDIHGAEALSDELNQWALAIAKDGQHYGPSVFHDGPNTVQWFEGQAVWSMAAALPYLDDKSRSALSGYLQKEVFEQLCSAESVRYEQQGSAGYPSDSVGWKCDQNAAALERVYALYLYAANSNDMETVRKCWPFIRGLYISQSARADRRPLVIERRDFMTQAAPAGNSRLIGHLGAYRLARMMEDPAVATEAKRLFVDEAPRQLQQVREPAIGQTAFGKPLHMLHLGQFDPLIPELARYVRANALEDARYTLAEAQAELPWWFLSSSNIAGTGGGCRDRGPFGALAPTGDAERDRRAKLWYESDSGARVGGENNFMNPGFSYQMYQAKALILMESVDELQRTRPWLNEWREQPWYRDMQGLENLVSLIVRHGTITWETIADR